MPISLVVADDHEVVRTGLEGLLRGADICIVAHATNGDEAVEQTLEHQPDVVLMDVRMVEADGLAALARLSEVAPQIPVVILSTFDNPTYIARSLALGAKDYVLKDAPRDELIDTIERAAKGDEPRENSIVRSVKEAMERRQRPEDSEIPLTKREMQVLRHLALGLSNRDIAASLGISVETVKEHVQNLLRKLELTDRTQAAVWAVRQDLA